MASVGSGFFTIYTGVVNTQDRKLKDFLCTFFMENLEEKQGKSQAKAQSVIVYLLSCPCIALVYADKVQQRRHLMGLLD